MLIINSKINLLKRLRSFPRKAPVAVSSSDFDRLSPISRIDPTTTRAEHITPTGLTLDSIIIATTTDIAPHGVSLRRLL